MHCLPLPWSAVEQGYEIGKGRSTHRPAETATADSSWRGFPASSDHVARLWELSSGETVRQYNGHRKAAVCVALNDVNLA